MGLRDAIDELRLAPHGRQGAILRAIHERWGGSGLSVAARAAGIPRSVARRLAGLHDPAGMIRREAALAAGWGRRGGRLIG